MKTFKGYLSEMYSFIPKTRKEILGSTLPNKENVAKLYGMILSKSKEIQDPLAIDFKTPTVIKVHRGLEGSLDLPTLGKATGTKLSYGNGSRGNSGAGNRGIAFEKFLSKDLGLYVMRRDPAEDYKYPKFMNEFIKNYLGKLKDIEVVDEGALNKPRPLTFTKSQVFVGTPNTDIGSTVTDITLKTSKGPMFLSLKMGGTVTFFNAGVTKYLTKDDIEAGIVTNEKGLMILKTLGIDPASYVSVFGGYAGKSKTKVAPKKEVNVTRLVNKKKLIDFLASGVGYGYFLIHANSVNTDDIESFYISEADVRKYVTPSSVVVQYPTGGSAKRIDVKIETPKFTFKVNIRNKQGGIFPSHIMCDYKVKH